MAKVDPILLRLDQLVTASRLNELGGMVDTDRPERIARIKAALAKLEAGAYLLGTGPSTVGIIPLRPDEIVLGRMATTMEKPADVVVDYPVADTLYFAPREVSRVHARIRRFESASDAQYSIHDMGSTCGTYVNHERIEQEGEGHILSHGDVISLGPSHVSTYMFYVVSVAG